MAKKKTKTTDSNCCITTTIWVCEEINKRFFFILKKEEKTVIDVANLLRGDIYIHLFFLSCCFHTVATTTRGNFIRFSEGRRTCNGAGVIVSFLLL
jgi:hypothetical protein